MTTLSIALVLIFVMWLIDKHSLWRRAGKIVLVIAVLGALGIAGLFGWHEYQERKADKELATEKAHHDALVKACLDRFGDQPGRAETTKYRLDQVACDADPNAQPKQEWVIVDEKPTPPPPRHHVRSTQSTGVDLTTTEFGSLVCGHVKPGQVVVLLQDDGSWIKVKADSGQVGWSYASDFEKVD